MNNYNKSPDSDLLNLLDPSRNPADAALLDGIQGNIVKGHGRDHVRLVFLEFLGSAHDVKTALRRFVNETPYVQSASTQLASVERYNLFGIPGALFSNVLLSPVGLEYLGFAAANIPEEPEGNPAVPVGVRFKDGAKHASTISELNDPSPGDWEPAYRETIHALIILADDEVANLTTALHDLLRFFGTDARVLTIENGDAIRNRAGDTIEHFGYIDGRSQPLFLTDDLVREFNELDGEDPTTPGAARFSSFDPRAKATANPGAPADAERGLALIPDPFAPSGNFGSLFVFRKLEQNVRAFRQQERLVAEQLGLRGDERELAGAYAVGRFEDGTPVAMRSSPGLSRPIPNDFGYADDPRGAKCPFASHIRKMNPRQDIAGVFSQPGDEATARALTAEERSRRIVRRGITYGEQSFDPTDEANLSRLPTGGVGLLFMCFQASIARQFAFLQKNWANSQGFVKPGVGLDTVIGQRPRAPLGTGPISSETPLDVRFPRTWGQLGDVRVSFHGFVRLLGSEFFFAPSMAFLRNLGI